MAKELSQLSFFPINGPFPGPQDLPALYSVHSDEVMK